MNDREDHDKSMIYTAIVQNMKMGMHLYHLEDPADDRTLRMVAVNPASEEITGIKAEDLMGKTLDENFPGLRKKGAPQAYAKVVHTGESHRLENVHYGDDRVPQAHFFVTAIALPDNHVGVLFEDITLQKQAEFALQRSLKEKDLLLKDVHHRVKNNLNMVSSLLNIQGSYLKDEQAKAAFAQSRQRIKSIALLHEKLYQSASPGCVEVGPYLTALTDALVRSYAIPNDLVAINLDIRDACLNADTAIPMGLMVTELLTNSLKYGFTDDRKLRLFIRLEKKKQFYFFTVGDNGPGLDKSLDWRNTETLGFQLVILLTEQLQGKIDLAYDNGTTFHITFPDPDADTGKPGGRGEK